MFLQGKFLLAFSVQGRSAGPEAGRGVPTPPSLPLDTTHPQRNNCDRRQRRKQGAVVGAAVSKTRVPPKARSGCWVPQPVAKGYTPLTILKKKSKHKKASAAPVGASALTLFRFSIKNPSVAARQLPPGEQAQQLPFPVTTPPVKIAFGALRRARQTRNLK